MSMSEAPPAFAKASAGAAPQRVVFLDRDGTINVDREYVYLVERWEWTSGAKKALQQLQSAGYVLTVITNQTSIGHGFYTLEDMHRLNEYMRSELEKVGVRLAAIAFCPHRKDAECDCRKPKIGMARQIEAKIGPIDYAASWTIGDKDKDVGFGKAVGTKTALIRSEYWTEADLADIKPDLIVDSLADFAQKITHAG